MSWQRDAACRGTRTRVFFDEHQYPTAKRICAGCPVANECLEWALENREWDGVYGGLSPRERVRLKRNRASNRRRALALLRSSDWDARSVG